MRSLQEMMAETGVAVWNFKEQTFVSFVPCPGEKRVRLDVFDDLSNYAVYRVDYRDGFVFPHDPVVPLGWQIDLT